MNNFNDFEINNTLQEVLKSITDPFFILNKNFEFTFVNLPAANLLDMDADSLIGRVIWEGCELGYDGPFGVRYREAMASSKAINFTEFFSPKKIWLEVNVYPSPSGMVVYFKDITESKNKENELHLLRAAISRVNDIILITEAEPIDEPGPKTVFVNEAFERRTGYSKEEVLGKTPRILQGENTQRGELDRIRRALKSWSPVRAELINYTKSGEEFWLELDIVPIENETGWYTHWVAIERDITEQKLTQQKMVHSQRMESIGQLTGGIAHDFNNLLTVVIGNVEMLSELLEAEPKLQKLANMTLNAAKMGEKLTKSLLAFSRKQRLSPHVTDVNNLIQNLRRLLYIGDKHIVELDLSGELWNAMVDSDQLENSIINLVINAKDAMPEGGKVTIETNNINLSENYGHNHGEVIAGDYILITIADTGIGIAQANIEKIFEPFYTTKPIGKGTGLGLATVFGFVKQSGGHISVYSEVGLGTTFKIYLPRASRSEDDLYENITKKIVPKIIKGATILVVEDHYEVMSFAKFCLENAGYSVLSAPDGEMASQLLSSTQNIDLLFSDVSMPGAIDGYQLAELSYKLRPALPVALASGFTERQLLEKKSSVKKLPLLSKPYNKNALLEFVYENLKSTKPD